MYLRGIIFNLCYTIIKFHQQEVSQMAVRHINPNAKEESGIFLTGKDATKVFSMFFDESNKEVKRKKKRLRSHIANSIKSATH